MWVLFRYVKMISICLLTLSLFFNHYPICYKFKTPSLEMCDIALDYVSFQIWLQSKLHLSILELLVLKLILEVKMVW